MRSPLPHQLPYRADIDGLRAFAVLSVILFHAQSEQLPGGYIGVDVFFVVSGFLITSLLLDDAQRGDFSLAKFYARRFRRILPALLMVLCAVFAAGAALMLPDQLVDLSKLIVSSIFFVPNLRLWFVSGYFAPDANLIPLLHLWSLGVEEQFYLFWPLAVLLFWKRKLNWIIAILAILSFGADVLFVKSHSMAVFYFPVSRLWELLAGAFLAWRERRHLHSALGAARKIPTVGASALSLIGMTMLGASDFFITSALPFPGWWTLPPVIGTMMIIAAGAQAAPNRLLLADPAVVFIGLISYPLYLWHWPILVFMRIAAHTEPSVIAKNLAMLGAGLLAWVTYHYIEKPIRTAVPGLARRKMVGLLLVGAVLVAVLGASAALTRGFPQRYPVSFRPFLTHDYVDQAWMYNGCAMHEYQTADAWSESKCIQPQTNPPEPLVIFWGDSHAADLRPGLDALQRNWKFRVGEMTGFGCPPFVGVDREKQLACRAENDIYVRAIIKYRPAVVILSSDWAHEAIQPLGKTIALLHQLGVARVVVFGETPSWHRYFPALIIEAARHNADQVPSILEAEDRPLESEAELKAVADKNGAPFVSTWDALCPERRCYAMTGGYGPEYVTYIDLDHLSPAGSELLLRRVAEQIFAGTQVQRR